MTQLAPAGVSPLAFLGFVGFVQPKLASSYAQLALQGQLGRTSFHLAGSPLGLSHPLGLPMGLLGHPAEPEPAAEGFVTLWQGRPMSMALPFAPSP